MACSPSSPEVSAPGAANAPGSAPAAERAAAPPAALPAGRLLHVSEVGEAPAAWVLPLPAGSPHSLSALSGANFPGAADPRGLDALVLQVEDSPAGHRETLWRVPLAGGDPVRLSEPAERVRNPAWSPDGAEVIFESSLASFRDLYAVPREGGPARRLTDHPAGNFEPAPSTVGLLFASSRDGNAELYLQRPESPPTRLTGDPGDDTRPGWRPDAARISWLAARSGSTRLHTALPDGTDAAPFRETASGNDLDYAWSPSGRHIAIVNQPDAKQVNLLVYDAVGHLVAELSAPGVTEGPAWSPDGEWLAFASNRSGEMELYAAKANGSELRTLTSGAGAEWLPRWVGAGPSSAP